jgi:hypothetical protein
MVHAANLKDAKQQISDELEDKWEIESVSENGTPIPLA